MQASIGVESPISMKFWEEQRTIAIWGIESQVRYKAKKEGWQVEGAISVDEAYFIHHDGKNWIESSEREGADIVMIYATAAAKKIEPPKIVAPLPDGWIYVDDKPSHRDGCTYPETQNWCEFHTTQYWQGKL